MLNSAPEGARYAIYILWRTGKAHVFVGEKIGGAVYYLDPQTGSLQAENYFADGIPGGIGIFRMDDKAITKSRGIIRDTVEGIADDGKRSY